MLAKSELIWKKDVLWQSESEEPARRSTNDPPFWSTLIFYLLSPSWLVSCHLKKERRSPLCRHGLLRTSTSPTCSHWGCSPRGTQPPWSTQRDIASSCLCQLARTLRIGLVTNPITSIYKWQCLLHQLWSSGCLPASGLKEIFKRCEPLQELSGEAPLPLSPPSLKSFRLSHPLNQPSEYRLTIYR